MSRRVWLHVGSPKTGTTYLQNILWDGWQIAHHQGMLLPLGSFHDHFLASVDLREQSIFEQFPAHAIGMWERLAEQARGWTGDVLVSHELFSGATAEQAAVAVGSFGDAEVHVVVTARDLERQIPAEWQEHIKHRSTLTFRQFVHHLRANSEEATWFWTVQDTADVCRRWGAQLPAERVHVVTVPRDAARPNALWERFASLVGLDPSAFEPRPPANTSLHAEQAELLRRLNAQLGPRMPIPGTYPPAVKDVLGQQLLAGRPGRAVGLTGDDRAFAADRAQRIVAELGELGADIVGSVDELLPPPTPNPTDVAVTDAPESTAESTLLAESLDALTETLELLRVERAQLQEVEATGRRLEADLIRTSGELADLQRRLDAVHGEHERLVHDMRHRPLQHLLIGMSEAHPGLMKARVAYWRAINLARRMRHR